MVGELAKAERTTREGDEQMIDITSTKTPEAKANLSCVRAHSTRAQKDLAFHVASLQPEMASSMHLTRWCFLLPCWYCKPVLPQIVFKSSIKFYFSHVMKRSCFSFLLWSALGTAIVSARRPSLNIPLASSFPSSSIVNNNNAFQERLETSSSLAMLEQSVEDYNAQLVATLPNPNVERRLICLPLDERFDPPMGIFSHGHVQTGDKMSVPRNFWKAIQSTEAEVSWQYLVARRSRWQLLSTFVVTHKKHI